MSGVDVLQAKKQEVAESMFNDFKNELNFFQSTVLSFFDKKITQTITSSVQVGASLEDAKPRMNFFEKLLIQLSPTAAEKVFMFIKEKQEQLVKANTVEELENLKKGIIVPPEVKPENQPVANPVQASPNGQNNQTNIPQSTPKQDGKDQEFPDRNKKLENIAIGAGTGVGLGISAIATEKVFKLQQKNKLAASINIEDPKGFASRLQSEFARAGQQLEKDASNPKLLKVQQSMMKKSAKEFEKIGKSLNKDTFTATEMLYKLEKRLPKSFLKSIDPDQAKLLGKLIAEDIDLANLLSDVESTYEQVKELLELKGVKNLNKDVILAMKAMKGADELKGLTHVLTNMKGIKSFMRGVKGIAFLDLISTGFDVRVLCEGLDEAEAYKKLNALRASTAKEHQRVQFGASLALTALSIIAACAMGGSAGGPIGTAVGAVIGVAGFAASQAIDIYYDKVEFYEQNQEDFKRQYRTEIKQAIIQTAASEEWNLNFDQRLHARFEKGETLTTTYDAWRSLIRQEEYKAFPLVQKQFTSGKNEDDFIKTLSSEDQSTYKDQKKALDIIIDKRMDYIKKHMYENKGTPEYKAFVAEMKNNMGIKAIERILTESKLYYRMNQTGADAYVTGAKTIAEYVQLFGSKVSAEYPEGFKALETMWNNQPYAAQELCGSVEHFSSVFANAKQNPNYEHQDKIQQMEKNIAFIKRYMEYKKLTLPIEEQNKLDIPLRAVDLPMVERLLISGDFAALGSITFNSDQAKSYFTRDWIAERKDAKTEYSDSVGQNIIYRIAKEIHGYEGNNDPQELMEFFREDKGAALGLYYSNGWKINNDWAIDKGIDIKDMQDMKPDEIMKMWTSPSRRNDIFAATLDPIEMAKISLGGPLGAAAWEFMPGSLWGFRDDAAWIDTKADAGDMDKKMNLEYRSRLRKIIREEKGYEMPVIKKMVEENIITYIKTYAKEVPKKIQEGGNVDAGAGQEQGYIELPYYLIIAAKRAKIGNLENFLFKYQDNKIVACTSFTHSKDIVDFSQTKVVITKEYINLGQQVEYQKAMPYITYVDKARDKFKELIDFNDNDLDLPVEYRDLYNKKIQDRERFKYDLLNMDPELAQKKLLDTYESYHDRFDSMYTAMLTKISKFSRSNDLDDAQQLQEAESRANKLNAVTIKDGIIQGSLDMFSENQKKIFYRILGEWKPRGKDILAMASSKNSDDNAKAIRSVKQIVKSMIEAQVVDFDEQGAIKSIMHGESKGFEEKMLDSDGLTQEKIKNLVFKRILINGNPTNYFIPPKIEAQEMDAEKVQITPVQ